MKELAKAKRKRNHKQRMEYQQKWREKNFPHRIIDCKFCKKKILQKPRNRKFCSSKCIQKEFRQKNSIKVYQEWKNWAKRNPDKVRKNSANRRARKRNAKGSFTEIEWKNLKKKFQYRCAICKKRKKLTVDHKIPLSKDGTNYISNIQPLCSRCNCKKYNNILISNKI
ncbi:MAG: HNH endonuclease [Nanoarchaeota archaeon]